MLKIVSLFDGCSVGQLAVSSYTKDYVYESSEINEYSKYLASKNFSGTRNFGDVRKYCSAGEVFLLMGGSPCTDFSSQGDGKGMVDDLNRPILSLDHYLELKKSGIKINGESYLFWEYVRILRESSPKYFLLENVKMKKNWEDLITQELGVSPIKINSSLFSGQHRERLYWTNIPVGPIPRTKDINIQSILEAYPEKSLKIDDDVVKASEIKPSKNGCIFYGGISRSSGNVWGKTDKINSGTFSGGYRVYDVEGKSPTITAKTGGIGRGAPLIHEYGKVRKLTLVEMERLQGLPDNYTYGVPESQRRKIIGDAWTLPVIKFILSSIFN